VPGLWARARSLWWGLRRRGRLEAEMDAEFRQHIELRTEDLIRSGLRPAEAARRARLEFGAIERYKDEARESRGLRHFDEARGDLRYAARSFWRNPGFTVAAVLTLALALGANAAVFSLVSASLLRPLPFEEADRLVVPYQTYTGPGAEPRPLRWWSYPQVAALQSELTTLSHLSAYYSADVNLSAGGGDPARVRMEMVSASYFAALGIETVIGRTFLPQEDSIVGTHPVTVLGQELWRSRFGSDPRMVGRGLVVNGIHLTVVGVAPAGFRGLTGEAEMWIPDSMAPPVYFANYFTSDQYFLGLVGRLRPGISMEQARAEVAATGSAAAAAVRVEGGADDWAGDWSVGLMPLGEARRDPATVRAQLVLAGTALFVLLIGVVNLSSLFLARATIRARETAVRAALGAGRLRLVRQGLVEGGLLGVLGGAVGVLLTFWSVRALVSFAPEYLGGARPRLSRAGLASFAEPGVDWRVIAFAAALALAAGMLAGLVPAVRATRSDLMPSLKTGARGSSVGVGSLRRPTLLSVAATVQVASVLVLLAGAGMLLQGFHRLRSVDPGFEAAGLLTFNISPPEHAYPGAAATALLERVLDGVQALPGVRSATVGSPPYVPGSFSPLYIQGRPAAGSPPIVGRIHAGPDHFRTFGIPLLRGRSLTVRDRAGRPRVAVINETAARRFWPGEDAVGKRVWFAGGEDSFLPDSLTEIVGVVGDVLYGAPGTEQRPDFYTPYLQSTRPQNTVTVRVAGDPVPLVPALRRAVAAVDPNLPIHDVRTMEQRGEEALSAERFATTAVGVLAGLGLLLASLGVYGVMAYSVAQRRREVGIRLALGATPEAVLRFIIGQGAALAAVGLTIGSVATLPFALVLPALVAGVGSIDLAVFATIAALLLLVALIACYLPARSAARVNPVETLAAD
jgi:predicted permease